MPDLHFGIDFGTTNSAVVAVREEFGDRLRFIPIRDGGADPIPSVISYDADGRMTAGTRVKDELIPLREDGLHTVIESVKTVIDGDRLIGGRSPVAIAADLLKHLSDCARKDAVISMPITSAVFAIPVAWRGEKRRALREAARRAGIRVLGFVSEPTAALLAMHQDFRRHEYVAVFDWGGGTLDVAVLKQDSFGWREVSKKMLPIAGDAIDERVARFLHAEIVRRNGRDLAFEDASPRTRQILRNRAEEVKRRLQRTDVDSETVTMLRFEAASGETLREPRATISKEQFSDIVRPIVANAIECLVETVRGSGVGRYEIGAVLAIGGSSQLVALRQELEGGAEPWPVQYGPLQVQAAGDITSTPAWLVARGAAVLARAGGRCARLADDIGLLVADSADEFYSVLHAGDAAADLNTPRVQVFGLVEESSVATFVVAARSVDRRAVRIGGLGLPVQGFISEDLRFSLHVDADDVLRARAVSNCRPKEPQETAIENVRWSYELDALEKDSE